MAAAASTFISSWWQLNTHTTGDGPFRPPTCFAAVSAPKSEDLCKRATHAAAANEFDGVNGRVVQRRQVPPHLPPLVLRKGVVRLTAQQPNTYGLLNG